MAAELARHGTSCRIIDRLVQPLPYCRAIGVTPRTLAEPAAGDRAPDVGALRRRNVSFPVCLFDILRGTEHVLALART